MKTLKRMMVALLALLPLATVIADDHADLGYDRMFVFGASFLDSGNHFAVTGETAHPPFESMGPSYGVGGHRFSNGPTWVEVLARDIGLTEWSKPAYRNPVFGNYAYGYGRARDNVPYPPFGTSLSTQVTDWIANGYCSDVPLDNTLFIVDSGYADLLDIMMVMKPPVPDLPAAEQIMQEMSESIAANIQVLYECGARNFLVAYLAPMEYAPVTNRGRPPSEITPILSLLYNYKYLTPIVVAPNVGRMNFKTVNLFVFVSEMVMMPEHFGFTNVTDSCVSFDTTADAFCKDRDAHLWWDPLHPTKKVHALMAGEALRVLTE